MARAANMSAGMLSKGDGRCRTDEYERTEDCPRNRMEV
jgi:hypothetical protein